LLIVVLASAVAAALLRLSGLAPEFQLLGFIIGGLFLVYLTARWTFAWRSYVRWNQIQQHRADLEDWARERKQQLEERKQRDSLPPRG